MTRERERLATDGDAWRLWGPYLSERAWGTVREDYSPGGCAWEYFPHDQARSRVYRWNEDGLAGVSDDRGRLCFAVALWNGRDPILKERLFGLTNGEGSHGEDVKEYYYYLDNTPTHSWMRMLYKYPQREFPYARLVEESRRRGREAPEFELVDTGVFDDDRYFDVTVDYAKAHPTDLLVRITATNRGPDPALLHLLPTLWFRNTWAWVPGVQRPSLRLDGAYAVRADDHLLGPYRLTCGDAEIVAADGAVLARVSPEMLFTENETNLARLFGVANAAAHVKDAFHERVVHGRREAVNPACTGTKTAAHVSADVPSGGSLVLRLRLTALAEPGSASLAERQPFSGFDAVLAERQAEADEFYAALQPACVGEDALRVQRQALAGMLWSKQFYHYVVDQWLKGDTAQPPPPKERRAGRNHEWGHLHNERVMSMPDKWEYPWYAAWDLAFHCIPLALVDPDFAKGQLDVVLREWYQHPNGQIPAYEWAFSDVNPPVVAWAAWRIYKMEAKASGRADRVFLERIFHKLLLNFTWWVNRKDSEGKNVFQGGFLGLDNIGVFDRSAPLPTGGHIEQSDGTSWMGMYTLNLMTMALELAIENPVYEDIATKFFEHFLFIADAMNNLGGEGIPLWNDEDEFFYDVLSLPDGRKLPLKVRSFVGLIPLFAVETLEPSVLARFPGFRARLEWMLEHRPDLARLVSRWHEPGVGERRLLALVRGHRMKRLLRRALDPAEFLSDFGVRALSRYHREHPYTLEVDGATYGVHYDPAESRSGLFGGNSNWRGPIWFPVNFLLIESLQKLHHYYGDDFRVEYPTGSGVLLSLREVADELSRRLVAIFLRDGSGRRPVFGAQEKFQRDPHWRDLVPFYEYFHGDDGTGLGASHQTGWTGLVAKLIQTLGQRDGTLIA
jgi:Mannosylglycerate hydrolase MGH1-like glycoside hydrolase domain